MQMCKARAPGKRGRAAKFYAFAPPIARGRGKIKI